MYMKAIKSADREMSLGTGLVAKDRPFKNKKRYNRRDYKKINTNESRVF